MMKVVVVMEVVMIRVVLVVVGVVGKRKTTIRTSTLITVVSTTT